jgi:AcrR family transcriptional regulator
VTIQSPPPVQDGPQGRPRGRPRAFDRDEALSRAAETFWKLGYEGASIVDLTAAMGITPQSLYAAFSSKAGLYREALIRYLDTQGGFAAKALAEEPNAIAALGRLLREAAREYCRPGQPRGCMLLTGLLACGAENDAIAAHAAELRAGVLGNLRARLERGVREGDLRPGTDVAALARFVQAVLQGMSLQARDGAAEADLLTIAATAEAELARHAAG